MPDQPHGHPHDFFDPSYVAKWAQEANEKRPQRHEVFRLVAQVLGELGRSQLRVLELGSGPGFLAYELLRRCAIASYYLLDFSPHMHDLARTRLAEFGDRVVFVEGDIRQPLSFDTSFDAVLAMQAVHELRDTSLVPSLYGDIGGLLAPHGVFVLCDPVSDAESRRTHLLTIEEHADILQKCGFHTVDVLRPDRDLALVRARRQP
jgi:SAM-dependent methyltransferase